MSMGKRISKLDDITITNASHLKPIIKNIADNYGLTVSEYLRKKLRIVISSEPESYKKPPLDY